MTVVTDFSPAYTDSKIEEGPELPFLIDGPEECVIAEGCNQLLDFAGAPCTTETINQFLNDRNSLHLPQVAVGALPFNRAQSPYLIRPTTFSRYSKIDSTLPEEAEQLYTRRVKPAASDEVWSVTSDLSQQEYADAVKNALSDMSGPDPRLRKVVLARNLVVTSDQVIDPFTLLSHLRRDSASTCFLLPLIDQNTGATKAFLGATPELLVSKSGSTVISNPLAGSIPRSGDPAEDKKRAQSLYKSDKDLREHAAVVEWVADILTPYCSDLSVPRRPEITSTSTMWHLATLVSGTLKDPHISSLELAAALHPTPAVCGTPYDCACDTISALEPFDRGFFAGTIGWCDAEGDGRWMVAIRCAELSGKTAQLFAGAGIVPGSDPQSEVVETSAKLSTLLRAFGIDEEGNPL